MLVISCLPPGAQGATITGMQGMGVRTPIAAEVAEATMGLLSDWHMPKGRMLTIGAKSMMVAFGLFWIIGRRGTVTISEEGAMPNVHFSVAPMQTYFAIIFLFLSVVRFQFFFTQFRTQLGGGRCAGHGDAFGGVGGLER